MFQIHGWRRSPRVLMIVLVCGTVLSCSSAPELLPTPSSETAAKWNAAVKKHVPNAQRASRMMQYGQQLFALQAALARDIAGLNQQGLELNENYHATRNEARQMLAAFT